MFQFPRTTVINRPECKTVLTYIFFESVFITTKIEHRELVLLVHFRNDGVKHRETDNFGVGYNQTNP